jgi:acylpyruvate hydrolase
VQVDGRVQQQGNTGNLIYSIPQLVAHLSGIFTLEPGDIILTGTPPGQDLISPCSTVRAEMRLADGRLLDAFELSVKWRDGGYQRERHWLDGLE